MTRYVDDDVRRTQYGRQCRGRRGTVIEIREDERVCAREYLARDARSDSREASVIVKPRSKREKS